MMLQIINHYPREITSQRVKRNPFEVPQEINFKNTHGGYARSGSND